MSTTTPAQIQVVIDCAEPHELADWWAETLGWQVEAQDPAFIRSMIDQGFATDADTIVHAGELRWAEAVALTAGEGAGTGQVRLLFQRVPEPKAVKNRIHFDVRPQGEVDLDSFREQLTARGAVVVGGGHQGPHRWVTYADPEGNEFCV